MVNYSDGGLINLTNTLALATARKCAGMDDHEAVEELCRAGWIEAGEDGGWLLH